jgi:hypothetical protein
MTKPSTETQITLEKALMESHLRLVSQLDFVSENGTFLPYLPAVWTTTNPAAARRLVAEILQSALDLTTVLEMTDYDAQWNRSIASQRGTFHSPPGPNQ